MGKGWRGGGGRAEDRGGQRVRRDEKEINREGWKKRGKKGREMIKRGRQIQGGEKGKKSECDTERKREREREKERRRRREEKCGAGEGQRGGLGRSSVAPALPQIRRT